MPVWASHEEIVGAVRGGGNVRTARTPPNRCPSASLIVVCSTTDLVILRLLMSPPLPSCGATALEISRRRLRRIANPRPSLFKLDPGCQWYHLVPFPRSDNFSGVADTGAVRTILLECGERTFDTSVNTWHSRVPASQVTFSLPCLGMTRAVHHHYWSGTGLQARTALEHMLESVVRARGKVLRTNFSATSRVRRATKLTQAASRLSLP